MFSFSVAAAGFGFGISLIAAIGAQNAFVLRQGLTRRHVVPVIAVCVVSDWMLMGFGIAGFGTIVEQVPWLVNVMRVFGGAFLIFYGLQALRRAIRPAAMDAESRSARKPLLGVIGGALAVTFLNPHVYLDTIVLMGSIATGYEGQKWAFGTGAMLASLVWFVSLGLGSRYLQPFFARPKSWQVLDSFVALIMFAIAASIVSPLFVGGGSH
ncbi:LysE/ArgO family amino acid transporter [Timonella sp. A28]|uniref:LysE/ArgO family amino acid transporter n=1 Tax=Timonella sp. A28 TaxID=3442640 RepID=UPI003EBAAA47